MDLLSVVILALIQGITEFLPISSSAHLILPAELLGWQDQGLAFDVSVHFGSLTAVIAYFRSDLQKIVRDSLLGLTGKGWTAEGRLGWLVVAATIPIIMMGFMSKDYVELHLRSGLVIACTTLVFGLVLWAADYYANHSPGANRISEYNLTVKTALLIGFAQVLALIPGTSRSGITMSMGLFMGMSKSAAARFSFLLSIPTIAGAMVLGTKDVMRSQDIGSISDLVLGTVFSAMSAYLCIHYFLRWLDKIGFMPFVIYRLILGIVLLAILL